MGIPSLPTQAPVWPLASRSWVLACLERAGLVAYVESRRAPRRLYYLTEGGADLLAAAGEVDRPLKLLSTSHDLRTGLKSEFDQKNGKDRGGAIAPPRLLPLWPRRSPSRTPTCW